MPAKSRTLCLLVFVLIITIMTVRPIFLGYGKPRNIHVKQDFLTIQAAIDNANDGDTIYVSAGTYYEHVIIDKQVKLIGEGENTTVIDGSNQGTVVRITANGVSISGFKVQNSGWGWYRSGIETQLANDCRIEDNVLFETCHNIRLNGSSNCLVSRNTIDHIVSMGYGIRLTDSVDCTVTENFVANNIGGIVFEGSSNCTASDNYVTRNSDGIRLYDSCTGNKITANAVFNNSYCGMIYPMPGGANPQANIIFHNNFINNTNPFIIQCSGNIWDDGHEGNYWTDYTGADLNQDGIGDTPYRIGADLDNHPLMGSFSEFNIQSDGKAYTIPVISNSDISGFAVESKSNSAALTFEVKAEAQVTSFCRIAISTDLMNQPYTILVDDGTSQNSTLKKIPEASNQTCSSLYFTYPNGLHRIAIVSGFSQSPPFLFIISALLAACTVITVLGLVSLKKLRNRSPTKKLKATNAR
jgi:parallel beta-helix repeat protein